MVVIMDDKIPEKVEKKIKVSNKLLGQNDFSGMSSDSRKKPITHGRDCLLLEHSSLHSLL